MSQHTHYTVGTADTHNTTLTHQERARRPTHTERRRNGRVLVEVQGPQGRRTSWEEGLDEAENKQTSEHELTGWRACLPKTATTVHLLLIRAR